MSGQETCNLMPTPYHRCRREASLSGAIKPFSTPINDIVDTNRLPVRNHKVCVSAYNFLCVTKWPFFVETSGPLFFKQINKKSKNFLLFSSCIWFYLGMFTICLKVIYTCLLSLDYGAMEKSSLAHMICMSTVHR